MKTWGFDPDGWTGEIFNVELRFERPPTEDELRAMGQRWSRFKGEKEQLGSWSFSGPFALVWFRAPIGKERKALTELLAIALELVPAVTEAIVWNASCQDEYWLLDPGPAFPGAIRKLDKRLPKPKVPAAFNEGMEARKEGARKKVVATAKKPPAKRKKVAKPARA